MSNRIVTSWGRVLRASQPTLAMSNRFAALPALPPELPHMLPYGNGRSYGDSCLNLGGALLATRQLDHLIQFDPASGVLVCESGVLFDAILQLVVPQGWFLPVTPGTRFVTMGGAIANDVHGKNHHRNGTIGCHVREFELLRSSGERLRCSPGENAGLFAATIGGLGLTGMITWASVQLQRIASPWVHNETIRFGSLDEFFVLCAESDRDYAYTVAWIDCASRGGKLGRGLFMRGNHAPAASAPSAYQSKVRRFPLVPPVSLVNSLSLKAFNQLYYHRQRLPRQHSVEHYQKFFYPLDGLLDWNKMYGPRGFYQYQCVIPLPAGQEATAALLRAISASGQGSFLAVLKLCGEQASPGLLSFPRSGVSLALDFPNCGARLHQLFGELDAIVSAAGGRLYPAKDGRMPGAMFRAGYPEWERFSTSIDPAFSSTFWRRVTASPS